jgi:hypothetical protein
LGNLTTPPTNFSPLTCGPRYPRVPPAGAVEGRWAHGSVSLAASGRLACRRAPPAGLGQLSSTYPAAHPPTHINPATKEKTPGKIKKILSPHLSLSPVSTPSPSRDFLGRDCRGSVPVSARCFCSANAERGGKQNGGAAKDRAARTSSCNPRWPFRFFFR